MNKSAQTAHRSTPADESKKKKRKAGVLGQSRKRIWNLDEVEIISRE
jgi:hypothetical protein